MAKHRLGTTFLLHIVFPIFIVIRAVVGVKKDTEAP